MKTPSRSKYMNFTSSYLKIPLVLATKNDVPFISDIQSIGTKKIGIPKGYAFVEILKNEMRYDGAVITDDLDMGALRKNYSVEEIPVKALQAGCDILLYCNEPESPQVAYEAVKKAMQDKKLDMDKLSEGFNRVFKLNS